MVVITDVEVAADQFELGELFEEFPDIEIEIVRIIPTMSGLMPLFWVSAPDLDPIEARLHEDPLVEQVSRLTRADDRSLFEVVWSPDIDHMLTPLVENEGDVLRAQGTADAWNFRIQFHERRHLQRFHDDCAEHGIGLQVRRVYNPTPTAADALLTDEQLDAIRAAHEAGYWEVPRRTTNAELAEELGVSAQAVSERLRRGLGRLVDEYVIGDTEQAERS